MSAPHLFISYASADQAIAMEVCALLEARGVSCWIAPRDVPAGSKWDEAIVDAIRDARAFLLILTYAANESPYVSNEVNHAFSGKKSIFTFRAEDVTPGKSLGFYLARHHWTDGFTGKIEDQVAQLSTSVTTMLGTSEGAGVATQPAKQTARPTRVITRANRRERVAWMTTAVVSLVSVAALGIAGVMYRRASNGTDDAARQPLRLSIALPEQQSSVRSVAVSPDGRTIVFAAVVGSQYHLWLRSLDSVDLRSLAGTDNARVPFWSPDGRFIGFFADRKLKVVSATGGPAQTLCDAGIGNGGTWGRDGVILFGNATGGVISRVSSAGGPCEQLTKPAPNTEHRFPEFLPDGQHFLYTVIGTNDADSKTGVYLATLSAPGGERLLPDRSSAAYVPPDAAHALGALLFLRQDTLMAQPLNAETFRPQGDPYKVADHASYSNSEPQMLASATGGVLAYVVNSDVGSNSVNRALVWRDRTGKVLDTQTVDAVRAVRASPDNTLIVAERGSNASSIWLRDPSRHSETRFADGAAAAWSPDGRTLAFSLSNQSGVGDLYVKDVSGNDAHLLWRGSTGTVYPSDWSPDGRFLVFTQVDAKTQGDIWLLPLTPAHTAAGAPTPYLRTQTDESEGRVSPDGHWMAYRSNASGREEVYVRPFPSGDGQWQVSANGGTMPQWRHDGRELFYLAGIVPRWRLMSATVTLGTTPAFGTPTALFDMRAATVLPDTNSYAVSASSDGMRFLVAEIPGDVQPTFDVIVNWRPAGGAGR